MTKLILFLVSFACLSGCGVQHKNIPPTKIENLKANLHFHIEVFMSMDLRARDVDMAGLQQSITINTAELAHLYYWRVVHMQYPCGDRKGFDEVLMVTNTGQVLIYALYRDKKRRLTIVEPDAEHTTTDSVPCRFKVDRRGRLY